MQSFSKFNYPLNEEFKLKNILLIFLSMNLIIAFLPSAISSQTITEAIESSHEAQASPETSAEPEHANNSTNASAENEIIFFTVQTGYFLSESNANRQVEQLKTQGLAPYIFKSTNSKGKEIFSVRLGKYETYKDASLALASLKKTINTPMIVTRYNSMQDREAAQPATPSVSAPQSQNNAAPVPTAETNSIGEKVGTPAASMKPSTDTKLKPAQPEKPLTMEEMQEKIQGLELSMQKMKGEADIRNQLKITEEESTAEEKDILEAAGQEYTLTRSGIIQFSYGIGYSYSGYDAIRASTRIEPVAQHSLSNSFGVSYGLKNNLSVSTSIPFVYQYDKVGTIDSMSSTDFGDLSLGWSYQPIKSSVDMPTIIVNGSLSIPVGRNPYEIQPGKELSTSSGIYDAGLGVSFSQTTDPVVAFSSFSVSYPFATQNIDQKRTEGILDEVDPGMSLGAAVGMGYALSYKLNLNMSFSYSFGFSSTYKYQNAADAETGDSTGASFSIGVGYKFTQKQNLNFRIGIPITSTRSFSLSFSTPINFAL